MLKGRNARVLVWVVAAIALIPVGWWYAQRGADGGLSGRAGVQTAALPAGEGHPASMPAGPAVLVLYDSPEGKPEQKLGQLYAIMLRNLLGHFDARVELLPVSSYTSGRMQAMDATFYLGTTHDATLPDAFLQDALETKASLVWFKYNLWQLPQFGEPSLANARGLTFATVRGLDAKPTPAAPAPAFFDTITYKNLPFRKFYVYDAATDVAQVDPDVGVLNIWETARARVVVSMTNSKTGETAPYVTRSGSFWYVADLPFTFLGPRDRYLVLADLLHDMLGVEHAGSHQAMIRLEDIHAMVNPQSIRRVVDYLHDRSIPFSLAVIPHYRDPHGTYSGGTPRDIPLANAHSLRRTMDYAARKGGEIVAHGYTHQHAHDRNPASGVSAEDYEFWDAARSRPLKHDSFEWALDRLRRSLQEFRSNGYAPVAWTTPHYQASPLASKAISQVFETAYQRGTYYTSDRPDFDNVAARDYLAWQFYPYIIAHDLYGQRVLPENLGNVQFMRDGELTGQGLGYSAEDLLINARYALAVRDGFASFFFHPFLLDKQDINGWAQLTKTVEGITELGFEWTSPKRLSGGSR